MVAILEGMRVVEISAFVAVPLAGLTLAQMGAEVIRVDPVGGGIDYRRWPLTADGVSLYWNGLNKGKRSVALDLRSEHGRDLVRRLIAAPDPEGGILITNLAPRWLDLDDLMAERADLIVVTLTGNPDGSAAVDYTVNASVGYPLVTGDGSAPVNHVLPAWDVIAGNQVALAVLAADRHRRRTGEGQVVRLALSDVAMATVGHLGHLAEVEVSGEDRSAHGNFLFGSFGKDFETADGRRVMVIALTPRQWRALVDATDTGEAMALLEATHSVDLEDEGSRFVIRHSIEAALKPWFATRTLQGIGITLDTHGVLWEPYRTFRQLLADDRRASTENPMFGVIDQSGVGRHLAPGSPLIFSAASRLPPEPAPSLGEHTDEVLSGLLDPDGEDLANLRANGII